MFSVAQMYQYFPYRLSFHHTHSLPSTHLCLQLEGLLEALVKLLCSGRQRAGEPVPADAEGSTEHTWGVGQEAVYRRPVPAQGISPRNYSYVSDLFGISL